MCEYFNVESFGFLFVLGLYCVIGVDYDVEILVFVDYCFIGDYLICLIDYDYNESSKERQFLLLDQLCLFGQFVCMEKCIIFVIGVLQGIGCVVLFVFVKVGYYVIGLVCLKKVLEQLDDEICEFGGLMMLILFDFKDVVVFELLG